MIAKNTVTYLQIGKLQGHITWPFVLRPFINASRNDQCVCVFVLVCIHNLRVLCYITEPSQQHCC